MSSTITMGFQLFIYTFVFVFLIFIWNIKHQIYLKPLTLSQMPQKETPATANETHVSVNDTHVGWRYNTPFPVDVVYTWVNGSDSMFQNNLETLKNEYRKSKSFSAIKAINLANHRFADNEALRFSLRSLEKYANWIRHVFVVTNGQIPNWLNLRNPRVTIVEHKDIFDESEYLPTFSALAIEHNIHKIRGLSERFLYMNDDFFFGKNVSLEDFYTGNNVTKIYLVSEAPTSCGKECKAAMIKNGICDDVCNYDHCAWDGGDCDDTPIEKRPNDTDTAHCVATAAIFYTNALYNREFGQKRRRVIAHSPVFMEKRVKQDLNNRFPKEVNDTSHRKIRSPLDVSFAFSYMHFLMESYNHSKRFEVKINSPDVTFIMVTINIQQARRDLDMIRKTKTKFICINDDKDYNYPSEAKTSTYLVEEFYKSMFPNPSSYEKHT